MTDRPDPSGDLTMPQSSYQRSPTSPLPPRATTGQPDPQEEARKLAREIAKTALVAAQRHAHPVGVYLERREVIDAAGEAAYGPLADALRAARRQGFEEGQKAGREDALEDERETLPHCSRCGVVLNCAGSDVEHQSELQAKLQAAESRARTAEQALRQMKNDYVCSCRDLHDPGDLGCSLSIALRTLEALAEPTQEPGEPTR